MAKRKSNPDLSRPLTEDERLAYQELLTLQAQYQAQERLVKRASAELGRERRKLRDINERLVSGLRSLPLFEHRGPANQS